MVVVALEFVAAELVTDRAASVLVAFWRRQRGRFVCSVAGLYFDGGFCVFVQILVLEL